MSKIKKIKVGETEYDIGVSYTNVDNTPNIPSDLADLNEDSTHRLVTDVEKATWNGKSDFSGSYNDLTDKPNIPSATSDLTNDSGFITISVNNLVNYYLKNEVYTKQEVAELIGAIQQFHYEVVQELPQTGENNIMYLVPKSTSQTNNVYDEYVYSNGWEKIGDTEIDLTNYVTITMLNQALADYTTTANLTTLLNAKQDVIDSTHKLDASLVDDSLSANKFVTGAEKTTWNGKQDELTAGDNITIENNVISASGGGSNVYFIVENSQENPFIFSENPLGVYMINWNGTDVRETTFYYKFTPQSNVLNASVSSNASITYDKDINATYDTQINFAILFNYKFKYQNIECQRIKFYKMQNGSFGTQNQMDSYVLENLNYINQAQTITAKKTFNVLPESSVTPTTNKQLVNKKYVDDQVGAINTILATLTTPTNGGE